MESHSLNEVPQGTVTDAEIEAAKTGQNAWTAAVLAQWGVPWPPPRGWRKRLTAESPDPALLEMWNEEWEARAQAVP